MTQQELADAVGVDRTAVSTWETGRHFPQRYIGRVEAVLGISLTEPEPELPEVLMREVAKLSPVQRERLARLLSGVLRRHEEGRSDPRRADG